MTRKRGNNEGTITKRADGRYEARITLADGRRRSLYGKTRQEVSEKLNQALQDKKQGIILLTENQTLEQFLKSWLEIVKHKVRESSLIRYRYDIREISKILGKISLAKLTPQQVQLLFTQKFDEGYAPATVFRMRQTLHAALEAAEDMDLVRRNVVEKTQSPHKGHHEMVPLSEEQVRVFLESVKGERLEALFVLAVSTGMRRGELLALSWDDLDFDKSMLKVHTNLQRTEKIKGGYILAQVKTARSRRSIFLSKRVMNPLRLHYTRQLQEKETAGELWDNSSNLVFPTPTGRWLSPATLNSMFPRLLKRAGLPYIRFHDLRHTAATLLLSHGVNPKIVSEMLGHSSVAITLDVYSHVMPNMQRVIADVMDAIL